MALVWLELGIDLAKVVPLNASDDDGRKNEQQIKERVIDGIHFPFGAHFREREISLSPGRSHGAGGRRDRKCFQETKKFTIFLIADKVLLDGLGNLCLAFHGRRQDGLDGFPLDLVACVERDDERKRKLGRERKQFFDEFLEAAEQSLLVLVLQGKVGDRRGVDCDGFRAQKEVELVGDFQFTIFREQKSEGRGGLALF